MRRDTKLFFLLLLLTTPALGEAGEVWRSRFGSAATDAESYALYREYQAKGGDDVLALISALEASDIAGTRAVLRHAAQIKPSKMNDGFLHLAVATGDVALVRALLAYPGIDVSARAASQDGDQVTTSLADAVAECSTEIATLLLATEHADLTERLWLDTYGRVSHQHIYYCAKSVTLQGWLQANRVAARRSGKGCGRPGAAEEMQALLTRAGIAPSPRDCALFGSKIEACRKTVGQRRRGKPRGHGFFGTLARVVAVPAFFLSQGTLAIVWPAATLGAVSGVNQVTSSGSSMVAALPDCDRTWMDHP